MSRCRTAPALKIATSGSASWPLAMPQPPCVDPLVDIEGYDVEVNFTRPPLPSRACCTVPSEAEPQPVFTAAPTEARLLTLENGDFLVLEDGETQFIEES